MRTVLVTGPGGAGRTTVAAATALATARSGGRTLLLSADPLDTLLGTPPGPGPADPAQAADGLWAARVDSGDHFRTELLTLQERVTPALDLLGARPLRAEELTELPGSGQFALLHALRRAAEGDWDVVVVDLPPLREALATLALPEQLRRYLRRLLPRERQAARALRPMMAQLAGVPLPAQWLYDMAAHRDAELAAVQSVIEDRGTTLRLVAEPGPAGEEALRLAHAGAALYGLPVGTLVPNRLLPPDSADPWLATLAAQQHKSLDAWRGAGTPASALRPVRHLGRDPHGPGDLARLDTDAEAGLAVETAGPEEAGRRDDPWRVEDRLAEDGLLVWCLPLPGVAKSELHLVRRDDELVLTVGPFRRIVPLPSVLRRCTVAGAALADGLLRVRFTPDAALWPRSD
ncbi:ArsA family ATPase [Streptomyces sp. NBC_01317]|uniref:ArsA family ATPase n=1 Tax=Streptomyces sp. NBC_01317 TaxID=2903822 RepID=UPI002E0E2DFE|nr:ArsA family ATPase [Streptomyces sp. NBC_01317]